MDAERRQYSRRAGPFDGSWSVVSSESQACRITDLSPGGCYVETAGGPEPGAAITMIVVFEDTRFSVPAEVVYLNRTEGFGVRFVPSDQLRALAYVMGTAEPGGYPR